MISTSITVGTTPTLVVAADETVYAIVAAATEDVRVLRPSN